MREGMRYLESECECEGGYVRVVVGMGVVWWVWSHVAICMRVPREDRLMKGLFGKEWEEWRERAERVWRDRYSFTFERVCVSSWGCFEGCG